MMGWLHRWRRQRREAEDAWRYAIHRRIDALMAERARREQVPFGFLLIAGEFVMLPAGARAPRVARTRGRKPKLAVA